MKIKWQSRRALKRRIAELEAREPVRIDARFPLADYLAIPIEGHVGQWLRVSYSMRVREDRTVEFADVLATGPERVGWLPMEEDYE